VLSFGRNVHFRGQKVNFWQKKILPKNKNSKIQKKIITLFISLKVAHSAQEAPKKKFRSIAY
jgi:hypothetical protein